MPLLISYLFLGWAGATIGRGIMGSLSWQIIIFFCVLFLLSFLLSQGGKCINIMICGIIISIFVCIITIWGLGQWCGKFVIYDSRFIVTAIFDNPAGLAAYLVVSFPYVFQLVFNSITFWKYWGWGVSFLIVLTIILSGSRMGLIGLLVEIVVLGFKRLKMKYKYIQIIYIIGLIIVIGLFFILYYIKKDSADGRLLIWKCSIEMISKEPILGYGPGSFSGKYMEWQADYLTKYPNERFYFLADNVKHPFNEYIKIGG